MLSKAVELSRMVRFRIARKDYNDKSHLHKFRSTKDSWSDITLAGTSERAGGSGQAPLTRFPLCLQTFRTSPNLSLPFPPV